MSSILSPITVTGFNHDIIMSNIVDPITVQTTVGADATDSGGNVFANVTYMTYRGYPNLGLPDNGQILRGNGSYQLQDYTSNNTLKLITGTSGMLTLAVPKKFAMVSLLAFSTNQNSSITVTANYEDGSSKSSGYTVADWYQTGTNPLIFGGVYRVSRTDLVISNSPANTGITGLDLILDNTKNLVSLSIVNAATGPTCHILAVSGIEKLAPIVTYARTSLKVMRGFMIDSVTNTSSAAGDAVASYSVSPALPDGLMLNTSTGVISGLPTVTSAAGQYTITVTGVQGLTQQITVTIEVIDKDANIMIPSWGRWLDGISSDTAGAVAVDKNNNSYVIVYGSGDLSEEITSMAGIKANTTLGIYVLSFTSVGVLRWARLIDTTSSDYGFALATDTQNNVYITGYFAGASTNLSQDLVNILGARTGTTITSFIIKLSDQNVPLWGSWIDGIGSEYGYGLAVDGSNNVYLAGHATNTLQTNLQTLAGIKPGSSEGGILIKFSSTGTPLWARWQDGSGTDSNRSVAVDITGNVFIAGITSSTTFTNATLQTLLGTKPGAGSAGYLIKYDPLGTPLWAQWIDGSSTENAFGVACDSSGNAYVVGYGFALLGSLSTVIGTKADTTAGAFIIKYLADGTIAWARWIDSNSTDYAYSVTVDLNNNIYVTGYLAGNVTGTLATILGPKPTNSQACYILKYTQDGVLNWGQWVDGSSTDLGRSVATDSIGSVYLLGECYTAFVDNLNIYDIREGNNTTGSFLTKFMPSTTIPYSFISYQNSNLILNRNVAMTPMTPAVQGLSITSYSIYPALVDGLSFNTQTGTISGTPTNYVSNMTYLIKGFNNLGGVCNTKVSIKVSYLEPKWGKWLDGSSTDYVNSITSDADGNIYVCGYSSSSTLQAELNSIMIGGLNSSSAGYLIKLDKNGVPLWGRWIDSSSVDNAWSVTVDPMGNVFVCGSNWAYSFPNFQSIMGAPPGPANFDTGYLIKFDSQGNALWGKWLDTMSFSDASFAVSADVNGNVYITGVANNALLGYESIMGTKPFGGSASYLIKFSPTGTVLFGKWLDSSSSDSGRALVVDKLENVYIAGTASDAITNFSSVMPPKPTTSSGVYLIKCASNGDPIWGRWIDGTSSESASHLAIDSLNNVYITGSCTNLDAFTSIMGAKPTISTNQAGYLLKYTPEGSVIWGRWLDGISTSDICSSVTIDKMDNVYIVGSTTTRLEGPLKTLLGIKPGDSTCGYLVKFNSAGESQWGEWLDGVSSDSPRDITIDGEGNMTICIEASSVYSNIANLSAKPNSVSNQGVLLVKYALYPILLYPANISLERTQIASIIPTNNGANALSYSITPALPQGLTFNSQTAAITGTPQIASVSTAYIVTASNENGTNTVTVNMEVKPARPVISYPQQNLTLVRTQLMTNLVAANGGDAATFTVTPSLPQGLILNSTTGVISGAATLASLATNYIVTATNISGSSSATLNIKVNPLPPNISYPQTNVYLFKGVSIGTFNLNNSSDPIVSYSISQALPTGLSMNMTNGNITGIPTVVSANASYTVTATNLGGSSSFTFTLQIKEVPVSVADALSQLTTQTNVNVIKQTFSVYFNDPAQAGRSHNSLFTEYKNAAKNLVGTTKTLTADGFRQAFIEFTGKNSLTLINDDAQQYIVSLNRLANAVSLTTAIIKVQLNPNIPFDFTQETSRTLYHVEAKDGETFTISYQGVSKTFTYVQNGNNPYLLAANNVIVTLGSLIDFGAKAVKIYGFGSVMMGFNQMGLAGGDPYIMTLDGEKYMIASETNNLVLFTGKTNDGHNITVRAKTRFVDADTLMRTHQPCSCAPYYRKVTHQTAASLSKVSYFEKLYIEYDNKKAEVDCWNNIVIENRGLDIVQQTPTTGLYSMTYDKLMDLTHYTKEMVVTFGEFHVIIKTDWFWNDVNEIKLMGFEKFKFKYLDGAMVRNISDMFKQ